MSTSSPQPFLFRRPDLARRIAGDLDGDNPFSPSACLFLTAPRRTGKSTFLRHDLVPEIENRNILSIYVDLWSNRSEDPGRLIADAIKKVMREHDNLPTRMVRRVGLSKIGVGPYASIDIDKIGAQDGVTLTDALAALLDRTGKRICLIVDEAQHALSSENGMTAMFALKAARDALNMREDAKDGPNLLLVFTGSHRDKLATLVNRKEQPFFGSQIYPFPLLDRDFTDAYTDWLNGRLAEGRRFSPDDVFAAFELLGRRPEFLRDLLKDFVFDGSDPSMLGASLKSKASSVRERIWDASETVFESLTPIQKAVLARIIVQGEGYAPFTKASLAAYERLTGEAVPAASVQGALAALREKGLVWQSARGNYALEQADLADWYRAKRASGET